MNIKDQAELIKLLKQLEPGFYPIEIFWEFCRLNKLTVFEFLPYIKDKDGETKLLLTKRPADDKFWPNMFHNPGCVVRQGDNIDSVIKRLKKDELIGLTLKGEPEFLKCDFISICRGDEMAWFYKIEVSNYDDKWMSFSLEELKKGKNPAIGKTIFGVIQEFIFTSKVD